MAVNQYEHKAVREFFAAWYLTHGVDAVEHEDLLNNWSSGIYWGAARIDGYFEEAKDINGRLTYRLTQKAVDYIKGNEHG